MLKIQRWFGIPELNGVLERRSVTECDGVVLSVTDMASTCVLCPRFEEPDVR